MPELDERLEAAARELHRHLESAPFAAACVVLQRHHRHRRTTGAFVVVIAACVVVALGVVVTRDVEPVVPGSAVVDPVADRLLFPQGLTADDVHEVMLGPDLGNAASGLVRSPSGALLRISVGERGGAEATPNVPQRQFNGRTYTVESDNGELAYVSLDRCAVLSVLESDQNATPWDANAATVLAAVTITGRTAGLALLPGWKSFGAGRAGHLIQLAYKAKVGATTHDLNLWQVTDSPVAVLRGLVQGPFTSTTFNNQPAWTATGPISRSALLWQDGPNAVALSGDLTLDELKQVAAGLRRNKANEWARYLKSAIPAGPNGTSGVQDTANTNDCGTPQLAIAEAGTPSSPSAPNIETSTP